MRPLIKRSFYIVVLLLSLLVVGSTTRVVVKNFLRNKEITSHLSNLGATKDEIKNLTANIKNYKDNFEDLWNEKSFRSIMLRNTASLINKETPTKIDEVTYLIKVETDEDKKFSYKYRVNFTYDEGKKIFDSYKETLYQDRKKYWCYDDRGKDFRKMKVVVYYEYFSIDMSPIGSYSINSGEGC